MEVSESYIVNNRKFYTEIDDKKHNKVTYSIPVEQADSFEKWGEDVDEKLKIAEKNIPDEGKKDFSPKKAKAVAITGAVIGGLVCGGIPFAATLKLMKSKKIAKYILGGFLGTLGALAGAFGGFLLSISTMYTNIIKNTPTGKNVYNFLKNETPDFDIKIEKNEKI